MEGTCEWGTSGWVFLCYTAPPTLANVQRKYLAYYQKEKQIEERGT